MALNVKANNQSRARNRILGILIALAAVLIITIATAAASAESRKTIAVVRLKDDISANALITDDMIEVYDMYYKEYEQYGTMEFSDGTTRSTIVTWNMRDKVVGQRYAAYYLRKNTVLFWDSTIKDQTRKNSYLYSMSGELLNIQMTTTDDFGDMVVPGDSLNIYATYSDTNYDLPSEEQYKYQVESGTSTSSGVEQTKTELMFSEVQILDMLNGNGQSIFDIYYEYISKTKAEQQALLEDDSFLENVQPASILLEVTSEEVERYMKLQSKGASYQMTLLPRKSSSSITDSLSDIQTALAGIAGLSDK